MILEVFSSSNYSLILRCGKETLPAGAQGPGDKAGRLERQSPALPASAGKSPGNGIISSTCAHRRDLTACGRTRHRGHCCGREPGQGNYRYPAAAGPSGVEQSMLAGSKHHCVHTHVISQPLPTTAGPSACRFPRTEPGVQHVWAPSYVWGSQQRVRAWAGVFAPVGRSAWLGAGARHSSAPGALQRWERGRAGGTCPSHSSSISAAVPVGRKTPGCFYLLAVPPLSYWLAQDHVCRGQDQLCCWAALQLCLRVRESEKSQRNPPKSAFVGPCTTECWPDPCLFLPKVWAEAGRRGPEGLGSQRRVKRGVWPTARQSPCYPHWCFYHSTLAVSPHGAAEL